MTSETDLTNDEGTEMKPTQAATFLVHAKEHGLTYAVVLLLAQQMGLLDQVLSSLGGMC